MGFLASADVVLLSDKWRTTVQACVLTVCVAALGIVAFIKLGDMRMILGTLGLLFVINRKALGLDMKKLKKITETMKPKK